MKYDHAKPRHHTAVMAAEIIHDISLAFVATRMPVCFQYL